MLSKSDLNYEFVYFNFHIYFNQKLIQGPIHVRQNNYILH